MFMLSWFLKEIILILLISIGFFSFQLFIRTGIKSIILFSFLLIPTNKVALIGVFSFIVTSSPVVWFITSFKYIEERDDIGDENYIENTTSYKFDDNNSISFSTHGAHSDLVLPEGGLSLLPAK